MLQGDDCTKAQQLNLIESKFHSYFTRALKKFTFSNDSNRFAQHIHFGHHVNRLITHHFQAQKRKIRFDLESQLRKESNDEGVEKKRADTKRK